VEKKVRKGRKGSLLYALQRGQKKKGESEKLSKGEGRGGGGGGGIVQLSKEGERGAEKKGKIISGERKSFPEGK